MYRFTRIVIANFRRFGSFKNQIEFTPKFPKIEPPTNLILGISIAAFFGKTEEEMEKKESDLIMAIKRGELFLQSFHS